MARDKVSLLEILHDERLCRLEFFGTLLIQWAELVRQRLSENDLMVVRTVFGKLVSCCFAEHISVRMVNRWKSILN